MICAGEKTSSILLTNIQHSYAHIYFHKVLWLPTLRHTQNTMQMHMYAFINNDIHNNTSNTAVVVVVDGARSRNTVSVWNLVSLEKYLKKKISPLDAVTGGGRIVKTWATMM